MRFYDTAQHDYVTWGPPQEVRIYVCGITPYDSAHLGHIFTFMQYDLLQRRLQDSGHTVTMVRNVTDVDEPIYRKAAELGVPYTELAARETASFQQTLERLNFLTPAHQPLASQYIEQMAAAVQSLVDNGTGYRLGDDVYFDTTKDPSFGSFCEFSEKLRLGLLADRGGDPERPGKRSPMDFLLWKGITDPSDPAAWDTSLGHGRPGWHIECSVMSSELLGTPFDLHGGGSDLIFPHHECEIAQTRALNKTTDADDQESLESKAKTGAPLSRHWLHVAPMLYGGEKMSKSLGNLVFAKDLLETTEASVIRLALMDYHYRTGGEWTPHLLEHAAELLSAVREVADTISPEVADGFLAEIRAALDDDLDTHRIIHAMKELAYPRTADVDCSSEESPQSEQATDTAGSSAKETLATAMNLIGLELTPRNT